MTRRNWLQTSAAGVAAAALARRATAAKPPNLVFILADDLGWTDLGCQGSGYYETPEIDKLARASRRFPNGYSCGPNCQPTRAALMTGLYGPRTGIYTVGGIDRFDWQSRPLRPVDNVTTLGSQFRTVAEALRECGYATAMFGKWHLGRDDAAPGRRGFDEALVSEGKHFNFVTEPRTTVPPDTYLADYLTDRAIDFITRQQDRPFFLYLPYFAVHAPLEAKEALVAKFRAKAAVGGHQNPVYAAMIASLDEGVGRVLATLDRLHLSDDTLVIFSSDNGGVGGYAREQITKDTTDNAPLRGGKGMLYEGGIRVPWFFRWPGRIQPGVCEDPILSVDLHPTLLDLAGGQPAAPLDGVSLRPALEGGRLGREALYWHFPGYLGAGPGKWRTTPAGAVRVGDEKLLEFFEDGRLELYNIRQDVGEQHNLAAAQPRRAKELQARLQAWRQATGAKMPTRR